MRISGKPSWSETRRNSPRWWERNEIIFASPFWKGYGGLSSQNQKNPVQSKTARKPPGRAGLQERWTICLLWESRVALGNTKSALVPRKQTSCLTGPHLYAGTSQHPRIPNSQQWAGLYSVYGTRYYQKFLEHALKTPKLLVLQRVDKHPDGKFL